jgi:hypothetical protein
MNAPIFTAGYNPRAAAEAQARDLAQRQIDMLTRLAEVGVAMAETLGRQAADEAAESSPAELALAYSRVARAVRMTIALQSKLIEDFVNLDEAVTDEPRLVVEDLLAERRDRVERIVRRAVRAEHDDEDHVERLVHEANERLDDEDFLGDILKRPIGEIVALICKDLGLSPDWDRLAQEPWAIEERRQGEPGSPFAAPFPLEREGTKPPTPTPRAPSRYASACPQTGSSRRPP